MTIMKPSSCRCFICYLCEKEKANKHKGLVVGSGEIFTSHICKACSRSNYCIWGSNETLPLDPLPKYGRWNQ
tara:strand:- start:488 stop:703 length:216 start_codon:yes stop_codon:yes gene_type:complete